MGGPAGSEPQEHPQGFRIDPWYLAGGVAFAFAVIAAGWVWLADWLVRTGRAAGFVDARFLEFAAEIGVVFAGTVILYFTVRRSRERQARLLRDLHTAETMLLASQKLEAFGILAASMAHDFNNTLTVIRGMADLAKLESYDPGVSRSAMDAIQLATFRAEENARHLVEFLSKPHDHFALRDLNVVTREFSPILRQAAGARTIVGYELEDGLPATQLNRSMLEQALLNLVINARDAVTEAEPPRIVISTKTVELIDQCSVLFPKPVSGRFVELSVTDNGCGIPEGEVARVFAPFVTTKENGTGLGLPSVLRAVQHHDGYVDVRSKAGGGTCVRLLIPIRSSERKEANSGAGTPVYSKVG